MKQLIKAQLVSICCSENPPQVASLHLLLTAEAAARSHAALLLFSTLEFIENHGIDKRTWDNTGSLLLSFISFNKKWSVQCCY